MDDHRRIFNNVCISSIHKKSDVIGPWLQQPVILAEKEDSSLFPHGWKTALQ